MDIRRDDLSSDATRSLLAMHLAGMHANTPPGGVFALDLSGLHAPEITVWSAWDGDAVMSIAALKRLPDGSGEVKSMRTHPDHLRKGVAKALLVQVVSEARSRGMKRLSLETGSNAAFYPALALYREHGFKEGEPYSDYEPNAFSRFFSTCHSDPPHPRRPRHGPSRPRSAEQRDCQPRRAVPAVHLLYDAPEHRRRRAVTVRARRALGDLFTRPYG